MRKILLCLKKNIIIKETPVAYLYNSTFTTEKDIKKAFLPYKLTETFADEKPPQLLFEF